MWNDQVMPNRCRAPNCNTGYRPRKKQRKENDDTDGDPADEIPVTDEKKFALFKFPAHKDDPEKRAKWIARVPRDEWKPAHDTDLFLCEKHFLASDIVEESMETGEIVGRK